MDDPLGTIRTTAGRGAIKVRDDSEDGRNWLSWTNAWKPASKGDLLPDDEVSSWDIRTEERCGDTHVDGFSDELPGCSRPRIHTVSDTQAAGHSMYPFPGDYLDYLP